ncbi:zinc carboxypeptidase [Drosophila ananassae]|nr:zinc carboxypeptidase [Drosophila ananassae]
MWRALFAILVIYSCHVEGGSFRRSGGRQEPQLNLDEYPSYEDIMKYLKDLARLNRNRIHLRDGGRSYENRKLQMAVISNGDGRPNKRAIFIDAALHAREWLCPITALYVIQQLVVNYQENSYLLDDYDWVVLPLANPDGYEYSRNVDDYWRNTRSPNNEHCYGTDLNRNFNYSWIMESSDLKDPCSENFAGSGPFSEPETRTVRDIMLELVESNRGLMYLSLHSANRSIYYPWRDYGERTNNKAEHEEIAKHAADRIYWSTGTRMSTMPGYFYHGMVGGISLDYAFKVGFPVAFIFEMSGKDQNGVEHKFFPPSSAIRGLVQESWLGIRSLAEKAIEKYPPSRPLWPRAKPKSKFWNWNW